MTRLKPELWLSKSQRLCRTCSPKPTRPWPTAGPRRQLFIWKERSSRHSDGSTIPPWTTAAWVSLAFVLPQLPCASVFLAHTSHLLHCSCGLITDYTNCRRTVFYCTRHSAVVSFLGFGPSPLELGQLACFRGPDLGITAVVPCENASKKCYIKKH